MSFATGTDAYARHIGRYGPALSVAHAGAAGLREGDRALDVGCGPGVLLAELAARLGAGRVAGVDPSEPFLALARTAVPGADLRSANAERLPFPDGAFDVAMSQLVVNFMADAGAGAAEMRRVARRTVTSCVWDYAEGMTMLRTFWDAALELDPDAPDEGRTMRHRTPDALAALWEGAGLREVETAPLLVEAAYADFEDLWAPMPSGIGPSGAWCASLDAAGQAALREAWRRRLGSPEGAFSLSARAWLVRGSCP